MVREKGTLLDFLNDEQGISKKAYQEILRSGKIPLGKERTLIIDRAQLVAWGAL